MKILEEEGAGEEGEVGGVGAVEACMVEGMTITKVGIMTTEVAGMEIKVDMGTTLDMGTATKVGIVTTTKVATAVVM